MKPLLIILSILSLWLASCKEPQEVVLTPQEVGSPPAVKSVAVPDTGLVPTPIDSGGVLPEDQYRYVGWFQINSMAFATGDRAVRRNVTSRVYVSRPDSPIVKSGRRIGFLGMDLGMITLNGNLMSREYYFIPFPLTTAGVPAGIQYLIRDLTSTYRPNALYTWNVAPLSMSHDTVSISSPDEIDVISPAGGSILSRNKDLELEWTGRGSVSIVISLVDETAKLSKALLSIQPDPGRNQTLLSSKVLLLLPANRRYCFTFSISNRRETAIKAESAGRVLVQAASVYNSYVELR